MIQDNGMGMSEEFQKVMFDPFTREDDKRISEIQGTGLGMAITRNIVNMMNGNIKVESKLGKEADLPLLFSFVCGMKSQRLLMNWSTCLCWLWMMIRYAVKEQWLLLMRLESTESGYCQEKRQ